MKKLSSILIVLMFCLSNIFGQDPTPTPLPENKKVEDTQQVPPEKLEGVPEIAPKFESEKRELPDLGRVGVDLLEQKTLTLKETIVLALENNKDIEVSRQNVKIAEFDLQSADGFYVPRISGLTQYERSTAPNLSIFSANRTTTNGNLVGNLNFQGFIKRYGSNYNVSFNTQRLTTNNTLSILNPQYNSAVTFSFVQPLFRGRKSDNQRRVIEIAKKNLSLTDTQFRQKSIDIIVTVQRAYWDLTFALRNLQVQRDSVRDAKEQLAHNVRLMNEGVIAPIDVVAAETQVANLEVAVYDALEVVNRAENVLKNLISNNRNDDVWRLAIIPVDKVENEAPRTTLPEALEIALQNRPELEVNETAQEINEIDRKFLKEQTKPQIDLVATYSSSGVSGSFNERFQAPFQPDSCNPDPTSPQCQADILAFRNRVRASATSFSGGIQSDFTDILLNRYPTVRFGVQFNFPLKNKTAEANLGKNLVEAEKIKTQREQLEQNIQVDVRNALQAVRTSEARLRSAAIARENSQKQYDSERRKFDEGLSDIYKVLERQTALMLAKSNELRSQTELNKAIAELQRATGNSLKANNVEAKLR